MGRCLIVLCLFTKFFSVRAKIYKSRSSVVFSKSFETLVQEIYETDIIILGQCLKLAAHMT